MEPSSESVPRRSLSSFNYPEQTFRHQTFRNISQITRLLNIGKLSYDHFQRDIPRQGKKIHTFRCKGQSNSQQSITRNLHSPYCPARIVCQEEVQSQKIKVKLFRNYHYHESLLFRDEEFQKGVRWYLAGKGTRKLTGRDFQILTTVFGVNWGQFMFLKDTLNANHKELEKMRRVRQIIEIVQQDNGEGLSEKVSFVKQGGMQQEMELEEENDQLRQSQQIIEKQNQKQRPRKLKTVRDYHKNQNLIRNDKIQERQGQQSQMHIKTENNHINRKTKPEQTNANSQNRMRKTRLAEAKMRLGSQTDQKELGQVKSRVDGGIKQIRSDCFEQKLDIVTRRMEKDEFQTRNPYNGLRLQMPALGTKIVRNQIKQSFHKTQLDQQSQSYQSEQAQSLHIKNSYQSSKPDDNQMKDEEQKVPQWLQTQLEVIKKESEIKGKYRKAFNLGLDDQRSKGSAKSIEESEGNQIRFEKWTAKPYDKQINQPKLNIQQPKKERQYAEINPQKEQTIQQKNSGLLKTTNRKVTVNSYGKEVKQLLKKPKEKKQKAQSKKTQNSIKEQKLKDPLEQQHLGYAQIISKLRLRFYEYRSRMRKEKLYPDIILMCNPEMISLYNRFSDAVSFQIYSQAFQIEQGTGLWSLVYFSGCNEYNNSIIFAFGVLLQKSKAYLQRLFNGFIQLMGKSPETLFTDLDPVYSEALQAVKFQKKSFTGEHLHNRWHFLNNCYQLLSERSKSLPQQVISLIKQAIRTSDFDKFQNVLSELELMEQHKVISFLKQNRQNIMALYCPKTFIGLWSNEDFQDMEREIKRRISNDMCGFQDIVGAMVEVADAANGRKENSRQIQVVRYKQDIRLKKLCQCTCKEVSQAFQENYHLAKQSNIDKQTLKPYSKERLLKQMKSPTCGCKFPILTGVPCQHLIGNAIKGKVNYTELLNKRWLIREKQCQVEFSESHNQQEDNEMNE